MRRLDLVGKKFHKLEVLEFANISKHGHTRWLCRCDCGVEKIIYSQHLTSGSTHSCGCLSKEQTRKRSLTHGHAADNKRSRTYKSWDSMKERCFKETHRSYKYYGERGITVCQRWLKFENFLDDMGERPKGKTLDRIDNDGNYEPSNCRWATASEQNRNKRKKIK